MHKIVSAYFIPIYNDIVFFPKSNFLLILANSRAILK